MQHALSIVFNWQDRLDESGVASAILLDLSWAFDSLTHDLIIAKLHAYGVYCDSLRLLRSYLTNQHQKTKLESVLPQGFILRSVLFNFFINDL